MSPTMAVDADVVQAATGALRESGVALAQPADWDVRVQQ